MEATYRREDVMQALVAALRYGDDIGIAAMYGGTGRLDNNEFGIASLHPGAGIQAIMSQVAADLLLDAHVTYYHMPPDKTFSYGRSYCDLITFNRSKEVSTHDNQEAAQGD